MELDEKFSHYGKIISTKIQEDEEGENMGFGFILFDNLASVDLAINELNEKEWKDKKLYVGKYIKNRPKINKFNNVYVKNIPQSFSDVEILEYFKKFGEINSLIIRTPEESELKSFSVEKKTKILNFKYAFICYKNFDDAARVVNMVPYFKFSDEKYNDEIKKIARILKDKNVVEK